MSRTTCPDCRAPLAVPSDMSGEKVRCPECGRVFRAPEIEAEVSPVRRRRSSSSRRRKKANPLLVAGIVLGAIFLACGGLSVVTYFAFLHDITETVTPADRNMLVTAERVAVFTPEFVVLPNVGVFKKVRHLDGSKELTYEYEAPPGSNSSEYISCEIALEPTPQDAKASYTGAHIGTRVGYRLDPSTNMAEVLRNDLWRWGDESKCIILTNNGVKVGNIFSACKGRKYFLLTIIGVCFEDAKAIHDLLAQMLQSLDNWNG